MKKRPYIKKPKAVVFDMDDTLVGFVDMLMRLHNKLHKTCLVPSDLKEYNMKTLIMEDSRGNTVLGEDLWNTFQEYEDHGLYAALKPLPEARHALSIISKLGYKIIIMTARKAEYEKQTKFCLLHQNLVHDELIFAGSTEKSKEIRKLSKKYNIVAFADDKASTVIDVSESTNVNKNYVIAQRHNLDVELPEEVKRVASVFEIVRDLPDANEP